MAKDEISLTIEGEAGQEFQIWYRGNQDAGEAPIVQTGKLGADGRLTVQVPRAYLLLGKPVRAEGVPLDLQQEAGASRTVRLPKARNGTMTAEAKLIGAPEIPDDISGVVAEVAEDGCNASILFSNLNLCPAVSGGAGAGYQASVATKAVTFRFPYSSAQPRTRMVVQLTGSIAVSEAARVRLILCAGDITEVVVDKGDWESGSGFASQTMFAVEAHAADPMCQITLILVAECYRDGGSGASLQVDALLLHPDCHDNSHLFQEAE